MESSNDHQQINYISQLNAAWDKISTDLDLKPTSIVVYFALLQINNLAHWKPVFSTTFGQVLNMTCIGNVKTYYSALEELVKCNYITWNKSKNQHQAATFSIIPLYQKTEEQNKSAVPKNGSALEEQGFSTRKSKGNIL
jgi:RNAse (barnase) inhibitor barstar